MDPTDSDVTDPISDPFTDDDEPVISYGNELAENKPRLSPLASARLPGHELPAARLPGHELPAARLPGHELPAARLPGHELPAARLPSLTVPQSSFNWAVDNDPSPFGRAPAIDLDSESDDGDGFNVAPVLAPVMPSAGLVHSRSGVYGEADAAYVTGYGDADYAADVEDYSEVETENIPSDPVIPADNLSTDPTSDPDSDSIADVDSIAEDDSMIADLEDVKVRDQFIQSNFGSFGKNPHTSDDSGAFISGAPVIDKYPFTVETSMFDDDFVVQSDPVIKQTPPDIPDIDNFESFNDPFAKEDTSETAAAFALECLNLGADDSHHDEPGTENFEVFIDDDPYSEKLGSPNTDAYAFNVKGNPVIGDENDPFGDGNFSDGLVITEGEHLDVFGGVNLSENDPFGDDLRAVDDELTKEGSSRFDYHTETSYDTAIQNHPVSATSSTSDKLDNIQDNAGTECFEVVTGDDPLIDIETEGNIFCEGDLVSVDKSKPDSPNIVITVDDPIDICAPVPDNDLEKRKCYGCSIL